jgi:parvulin-like peptidyl-prolyl isomerase
LTKKVYVSILTVIVAIFWQCNTSEDEQSIIAKVDQVTISNSDYVQRYSNFLFSTGVEDNLLARRQMIDNMVNEVLLLEFEDNQTILNDPDFINKKDQIYKEVLLAFYKEKEVYQKIQVSEDELKEEFVRVNEQISARHIYAPDKEEADHLYAQLLKGFTFDQLASLVFTDKKLANNGGYLGYFSWGDMDPDFEEAAFSLKIGEISKPVRTAYGYSIIKVEDRFRNPILTEEEFNRKKESLLRLVRIRKNSQMKRHVTATVAEELDIRIEESALKEMMELISGSQQQIIAGDYGTDDLKHGITLLTSNAGLMTIDQAMEEIHKLPASTRSKIRSIDHLRAALRGIVVQQELIYRSVDKGYDQDEKFLEKYEKWVATNLIAQKYQQIYEMIEIPESEIIDYYEKNKNEFIREVQLKVQDIIVLSEADANEIIGKLKAGSDFTDLAKKNSLRNDVEQTGGISPFVPLSRFGDYKDTFKNAPLHQLIGPLKISNFYMIAKVIARENQRLLTFEEVHEGIKEVLKQEKKSKSIQGYLDNLRSEHQITIDQDKVASAAIIRFN